MAHNWNCPSRWEAESEARRNAERDVDYRWGKSYSDPYDCHESNRAYRDEYDHQFRMAEQRAEEERVHQRKAASRREQEEMERDYYRQAEEEAYQQQMEADMQAAMEADYADQMEPEQLASILGYMDNST